MAIYGDNFPLGYSKFAEILPKAKWLVTVDLKANSSKRSWQIPYLQILGLTSRLWGMLKLWKLQVKRRSTGWKYWCQFFDQVIQKTNRAELVASQIWRWGKKNCSISFGSRQEMLLNGESPDVEVFALWKRMNDGSSAGFEKPMREWGGCW